MPIAPKIDTPSIQQNYTSRQPLSVEALSELALRFRPILQEIFEDKWFQHTQIFKHVSGPYKNTEVILSLVHHWEKAGIVEVNNQSKPGGERNRVYCRFIKSIPIVPDDLDSYLALFKVNLESGNSQARYHGYRIVIHKPKKIDNTGKEWSYILNLSGEKGGKFCTDLFLTELEAMCHSYAKIHKILNQQNQSGES